MCVSLLVLDIFLTEVSPDVIINENRLENILEPRNCKLLKSEFEVFRVNL